MDNLFAVISSTTNGIGTNKNLSCGALNNTQSVSTQIFDSNNVIYLTRFLSNKVISADKCRAEPEYLDVPIIGNVRLDDKSDFNALNKPICEGKDQHSSCDERILFNAYRSLNIDAFRKIKGNFHAIFWDEHSKRLCAVIDPFSSRSLFYMKGEGALYIASDIKTLVDVTKTKLTVNKSAVSQWLAGRPDPDLSMFNEISRLPSGYCLEYSAESGIKITKFWDIDPNFSINYKNTEEYKTHFFDLLQTSVANRLAVKQPGEDAFVFCQMSGGMDSTSITAITKQLLDKKKLPLHTLSHRYKNTNSCDESSNINDMVAKLKLKHQHYIDLDRYNASSFTELYPTDIDNPGVVLSPKYHQELALMHSLGANILLTGNGGDETCWGHSASYRSRLYKGEVGVVREVISACDKLNEPIARSLYKLFMPTGIQNLIKLARHKPLNTDEHPPWLTRQAIDVVKSESVIFNPFSKTFDPARHARYEGLKNTSTYNSMRSYQKVASEYGIDVRHPFFDTNIVEFSFAVPEKLLIQGAYPKWLLRQTMHDHLPESVCWNKHKVVFDHHFAKLVRSNKLELRKLLSHEGLQDLGLLNNQTLLKEFDAVVENPNGCLNVDMLYAVLTQLWYQTHCINC